MESVFAYGLAVTFLIASYLKDRTKTKEALKKAYSALEGILPDFLAVLGLVGLALTLLPPETITTLIGRSSGWAGMILASIVGSVTLIPGFVAFPLAKSLRDAGAGIAQIAVFVTTLMAVGFVTAPLESKYFGRKETVLRNGLSFIWAFVVALVLGVVVR